ncbi:hypothetical protein [Streptomyces sp. IBSBF 2806]|uniref:hypothetical protein n=1 Tax=Streptomyces sp. IBSBF 2806 TaxID=2903529 RepID=UPI002FDBD67E
MSRRLLFVPVISLFAATMFVGSGHAASGESGRFTFVQQADRLGLTTAERHSVQSRVNAYIEKRGGTQVALNKISLDDQGSYALLTLPGEKKVREVSAPKASGGTCDYYYFCIYEKERWEGSMEEWKHCNNREIPYTNNGSWVNNQTYGTRAKFKDFDAVTRWTDGGAFTADDSADFNWVFYVKAC